jgi:hypothetical protein
MLISPIELKRFRLPHVENSQNGDGCMELDSSNRAHLLDHLLGLDQRERNSRFQCGATNNFITRYFLGICAPPPNASSVRRRSESWSSENYFVVWK